MTTAITTREQWDQLKARFQAMLVLFQADDQWGPLAAANSSERSCEGLLRDTTGDEHEQWRTAFAEARGKVESELERHLTQVWQPMIEAGLALARTPAPDVTALLYKHEIIVHPSGARLVDYEDEEGELFAIIKADVERLTA